MDLLIRIVVHYVLECLIRWVNDEGISVESLQYDGVLNAESVIRQLLSLPDEPVSRLRQELAHANVAAVLESDLFNEKAPLRV